MRRVEGFVLPQQYIIKDYEAAPFQESWYLMDVAYISVHKK